MFYRKYALNGLHNVKKIQFFQIFVVFKQFGYIFFEALRGLKVQDYRR